MPHTMFARAVRVAACSLFLLFSACDSVDTAQNWLGIGYAKPGIVATVNGVPILLRDVENYADMRTPATALSRSTVEGIWAAYADSLYDLIIQELIRQELHARDILVDPEGVTRLERLVAQGYGVEPGPDLDAIIEDVSVDPEAWRAQLLARVEQETLEEVLVKSYAFSLTEVEEYLEQHPGEAFMPDQYEFLLVEGLDQSIVEDLRAAGASDENRLHTAGLRVERLVRSLDEAPEAWQEDLLTLEPGDVSPHVHQIGASWTYLVLLGREEPRPRTPLELYSHAEEALGEGMRAELYAQWVDTAMRTARIKVARQMLPQNVPDAPTHMVMLPWEVLEDGEEDGMGEVEGEVQ